MSLPLTLIAAMALNRTIGRDGRLPWRLGSDLKRFKAATMGKPLVMGRRTFDEIGRPLPGRTIIVLSSSDPGIEGILHERSLAEAIATASRIADDTGAGEIIVAGGSSVYRETLPVAQRLLLTVVDARIDGDAFFPDFDIADWREQSVERFPAGPRDEYDTTVWDLRRASDTHAR